MLINFVGSPHSGKTTLAAKLFEHFKTDDIPVEFITERARQYIVEKRFREKLLAGQQVFLNDDDQVAIMRQQLYVEGCYLYTVSPQTIVISDSSPLNTLMYLSPEGRKRPEVQEIVKASVALKSVVFWARVTPGSHSPDTNRIHGEIVSRQLDAELPGILGEFAPDLRYTEVRGSPIDRYHQALSRLLEAYGVR